MKHQRQTLYSCKQEIDLNLGDRYRISKFVDGELESSYLTTYTECDCPAGVRPSCRHRQMLPQAQAAEIINTHWFWDFDLGRPVDFSGELKSNIDAMNELAARDADGYDIPEGDGNEEQDQPEPTPVPASPAPANWRRF